MDIDKEHGTVVLPAVPYLSPAALERVVLSAPSPHAALFIRFLYYTGARPGEVLQNARGGPERWVIRKDIDYRHHRVRIPLLMHGWLEKNGKTSGVSRIKRGLKPAPEMLGGGILERPLRTVPLHPKLRKALMGIVPEFLRGGDGPLLAYRYATARLWVFRSITRAGLPVKLANAGTLRYSYAVNRVLAGATDKELMAEMGYLSRRSLFAIRATAAQVGR